ncbi:MAG: uroporphyrinogen decarboxylase family protein [Spirochaetia bacterium]
MSTLHETGKIIDRYKQRLSERREKLVSFFSPDGDRRLLVVPRVANQLYTACNNIDEVIRNNIDYCDRHLAIDLCDDLPYLEPWMGVGVYASAFGSEYKWDTGGAPDTLYRYRSIEDIRNIETPDWRSSPIMRTVVESIDRMTELTGGEIPIALTDTQSAQDTATLILETTEFLTGLYTDPETIENFLNSINRLIIDFSREQMNRIGHERVAKPGHGFHGLPFLRGLGVSDDNMVFSSPDLNERFSFPHNTELSENFGGLALHSCGDWAPTMKRICSIKGLYMIDFALTGHHTDADPCEGQNVREAVGSSDLILKARVGPDIGIALEQISRLAAGGNKLIVEFPSSGDINRDAETYKLYRDKVGALM